MRINKSIRLSALLTLVSFIAMAQPRQQLRGVVIDQLLQKPLSGATITLIGMGMSTMADEQGIFRFR